MSKNNAPCHGAANAAFCRSPNPIVVRVGTSGAGGGPGGQMEAATTSETDVAGSRRTHAVTALSLHLQ